MKRQIRKIAQMMIVFSIAVVALAACNDADEEIFSSAADLEIEKETDEQLEKKAKPS
ncbi:MAG: hypothetical protein ABJG78_14920 [Cyclobacteriaceae bacterium]